MTLIRYPESSRLLAFCKQQTEGLRVGCGWVGGGMGLRNGRMVGFAKVDNRFGYEKWT